MTVMLFAIGAAAAAGLIPLLLRTLIDPQFRIWPTPQPGGWLSRLFWTLFRTLNVAALATALTSALTEQPTALGLPVELRGAALIGFAVSAAVYGYALLTLGTSNTYCNPDGLITHGIYRWTRNPQYAAIIPVYALLAVGADNSYTYPLSAALIAVYTLMALVEEPWLEVAYGAAYRRYCRRVPRFINWHRASVLTRSMIRRLSRSGQLKGQVCTRLAGDGGGQLISTGFGRKRS